METSMEEGDCLSQENETTWNDELDMSQLCRICANPNEYLIPIFYGEGQEHELETKIAKHLPIKVKESDELPTNLCYQCASTLIAWHDMVEGFVEADEKLKTMSSYKTGKYTKATSKSINKENQTESCIDPQDQNIPLKKINAMAHISQGQDKKPLTSVEKEEIAIEEETTSVKPGMMEEESTDSRFLSFRNYQIAFYALREKLMNPKIKQLKHTRNITDTPRQTITSETNTSMSEALSCKTFIKNQYKTKEVDNLNCDGQYVKPKHQCTTCGRVFTRSYDLKRHTLVHLNDALGNSSGAGCVEKEHLDSKSVTTHKCEVCFRVFKAKDSYARHKRIHTNERPFCCNECGKCFRDSGALTRHTKEVHARIRNHPCSVCNKWFVNRSTLDDHYRTHTGERPFVCHQCGVMFKSRAALYQHSKTHTNYLPHVCIYCGKCFRRKQELDAHLPIHTNEKTHICEKCGKAFSTRSELHRHIIVHSDEKPFSCLICSLNFSQKRYLKNHMKSRHNRNEELPPPGTLPVEHF